MIVVREDFPAPLKAEMPHESRRLSGRFRAGIAQFQQVTFCQVSEDTCNSITCGVLPRRYATLFGRLARLYSFVCLIHFG